MSHKRNHIPWTTGFCVATFLVLLLGAHSYVVLSYTKESSKWLDSFLRICSTWYIWAAFFPLILRLAGQIQFSRGKRLGSSAVLLFAGAGIAAFHAVSQILFHEWLLHPERNWIDVQELLKNQFGASCLTRFFVYLAILSVGIALEFYRKAREAEIRASQMEAGIYQAQIESIKIQLDPDDLFQKLRRLSNLMYEDLDEAESMIAQMGDDLRTRLFPLSVNRVYLKENMLSEQDQNSPQWMSPEFRVDSDPVRNWLIVIAVFTLLAVYFTLQNMLGLAIRGMHIVWSRQLLDCSGWYIWALLTPVVLKIVSKFPFERNRWMRLSILHSITLVFLWFVATIAMTAVRWASDLGDPGFVETLPILLVRSPLWLDIVCYSTIIAIESALRYHHRFQFEKIRTARLAAQLAHARLQALRMQIHPHFLFNSLNSLSELMREDPAAGAEMICNLEKFLRLTVTGSPDQEILFEQEIQFLKCYLAIEDVRYADRLRVKMDIEPQTLNVRVPNLLLQPIVENAIRHGIAPRSTPGIIEIEATRNNGVLKLKIRDNGPGIRKTQKSFYVRSGLGLSNTRERLIQLYGDAHRFELVNAPEGGLIVSLQIPVHFNAETAQTSFQEEGLPVS